ncbi:DUF1697 domain-containing protein [Lacrimispora celerecrescens]|nr:DUF1697 domain-containing protein [Lacrimispora celerecrescens]
MMTIYTALLRGINVGGKNKIKMAELRQLLEEAGLTRVETYIQSGNVIFEAEDGEEKLKEKIENKIREKFGLSVSVILRTSGQLEQIIRNCPYTERERMEAEALNSEGESFYVCLFHQAPLETEAERLKPFAGEFDDYRIQGRDIYLLLRHSIRNSKLAAKLSLIGGPATVRNWKTMEKLYSLVLYRAPRE